MRDVGKEADEQVSIGAIGWMKPDLDKGEIIEGLQSVVAEAARMEAEGLISIRLIHKEAGSGSKSIDAIQFIRRK